jgi:hypothetical protein
VVPNITAAGTTLADSVTESIDKRVSSSDPFAGIFDETKKQQDQLNLAFAQLSVGAIDNSDALHKLMEDQKKLSEVTKDEVQKKAEQLVDGSKNLREFNENVRKAAKAGADTSKMQFEGDLGSILAPGIAKLFGQTGKNRDALESGIAGMFAGGDMTQGMLGIFGRLLGGSSAAGGLLSMLGIAGGGGGIGSTIATAVGTMIQAAVSMVIQGIQQVVGSMVNAAQAIPQMIAEQANKLGALIPSEKVQKFIQAAFNPLIGQTLGMAAVFGVLAGAVASLAPVWNAVFNGAVIVGGALAGLSPLFVAATAGLVALMPTLVGTAAALVALETSAVIVATTLYAAAAFFASALASAYVLLVQGTAAAFVLLIPPVQLLAQQLTALGAAIMGVVAPVAVAFSALLTPLLAVTAAVVGLSAGMVGLGLGFFKLAADTESFKRLGEAFEASMARVITALEPFFQNLMPLAGLFSMLIDVMIPLAASFASNQVMASVLFQAFKMLAIGAGAAMLAVGMFAFGLLMGIASVAKGISIVVNTLNSAVDSLGNLIATILDTLGLSSEALHAAIGMNPDTSGLDEFAAAAAGMAPDVDAMAKDLEDIMRATEEGALASLDTAKKFEKAREASEELTNIPQGFKVVAARFRAIVADSGGSAALGVSSGGGGRNYYIDNMQVMAEDAKDFALSLEAEAERRAFQQTGTTGTRDGQNNGNN